MNANELRIAFPNWGEAVHHDPDASCTYCKGTGVVMSKALKERPCICTVVDHEYAKVVQESIQRVIKNEGF